MHNERIMREIRQNSVHGYILSLGFSDKYEEAIVEAVLDTGIHLTANDNIKYAIAALIETSGVAFICQVWIYIAAEQDCA